MYVVLSCSVCDSVHVWLCLWQSSVTDGSQPLVGASNLRELPDASGIGFHFDYCRKNETEEHTSGWQLHNMFFLHVCVCERRRFRVIMFLTSADFLKQLALELDQDPKGLHVFFSHTHEALYECTHLIHCSLLLVFCNDLILLSSFLSQIGRHIWESNSRTTWQMLCTNSSHSQNFALSIGIRLRLEKDMEKKAKADSINYYSLFNANVLPTPGYSPDTVSIIQGGRQHGSRGKAEIQPWLGYDCKFAKSSELSTSLRRLSGTTAQKPTIELGITQPPPPPGQWDTDPQQRTETDSQVRAVGRNCGCKGVTGLGFKFPPVSVAR